MFMFCPKPVLANELRSHKWSVPLDYSMICFNNYQNDVVYMCLFVKNVYEQKPVLRVRVKLLSFSLFLGYFSVFSFSNLCNYLGNYEDIPSLVRTWMLRMDYAKVTLYNF